MTLDILFKGRMSRKNYIIAQILLMVVSMVLILFVLRGDMNFQGLINKSDELVTILLFLAPLGLLFQFVCSFRRLHDINQSGLWALLLFASLVLIPFIDLLFIIFLSYKKAVDVPNKYGIPDTRTIFNSIINK